MKKHVFLLFLLGYSACLFGQQQPDTFRLKNYPFKVWHNGERVKRLGTLEPVVLSKNDNLIRQNWQNGKTLKGVGLGVQAIGVVMMGASLAQSANGDDGSGLLVGGAAVSLGGMVIQISGTSKQKKAIRRFNDLEMGRAMVVLDGMDVSTRESEVVNQADSLSGEKKVEAKPAQPLFSNSTPLKKGGILIATSTGLGGNATGAGIAFNNDDEEKNSVIRLSPVAGYFFNDGLAAGLNLQLASATSKDEDSKTTNSIFLAGPFVRYYGDLPGNPKMKWMAEAAVGFGSQKTKFKFGNNVIENVTGLFSLSLGPGVSYFLNQRVAVEAQATYERLSQKDKETGVEHSQGSMGLRVGFGVFL